MIDLPSVVKFPTVESYVDEANVYHSFYFKDIDSWLTKVFLVLYNKLLINPSKTNLILFGMRQLLSKILDVRVPFLGQNLAPVPSVKYLGVILNSNLTFNEHDTLTFLPYLYSVSDKQS